MAWRDLTGAFASLALIGVVCGVGGGCLGRTGIGTGKLSRPLSTANGGIGGRGVLGDGKGGANRLFLGLR